MFFRFLFAIILSLSCTGAWAQFDTIRTGSVLVLDQASLFTASKLGQDILVLEQSEQIQILEESQLITLELQAEETALTEQRAIMPNDDFRVLADAFNEKVETIRASQIAIDDAHLKDIEARRRAFFQYIVPFLAELLKTHGASVIIDRRSVLLFDKSLDITAETIALLDKVYEENPDMINLGN